MPIENPGAAVPSFAKRRYSDELISATREVWQPYYPQTLTDEDVREIIENMVGFMGLLSKIRDKNSESDDSN